ASAHVGVRLDAQDADATLREQPRGNAGAAAHVYQQGARPQRTVRDDEVNRGGGVVGAVLGIRAGQPGESAQRIGSVQLGHALLRRISGFPTPVEVVYHQPHHPSAFLEVAMFDHLAKNTLVPLLLRWGLAAIFLYHGGVKVTSEGNELGAAWAK